MIWVILLGCPLVIGSADGHGYMTSPAARNSAWRFGFDTKPNYGDNELNCGGRETMHLRNKGQCGVCGDNWKLPRPRPHERGGKFGRGVITANYIEGQVMPITIRITANHKGWYEFRLCSNNDSRRRASQRCLDKNLLQMADGSGIRYNLRGNIQGDHVIHVTLPRGVSCTNCILQWTWVAGNSWGTCPNGTGATGCGPQETFVNCADISILPKRLSNPSNDRRKKTRNDTRKPSNGRRPNNRGNKPRNGRRILNNGRKKPSPPYYSQWYKKYEGYKGI